LLPFPVPTLTTNSYIEQPVMPCTILCQPRCARNGFFEILPLQLPGNPDVTLYFECLINQFPEVPGKHVLCENPLSVSIKDWDDMVVAAKKEHGKLLLDSTMFPHHARTNDVLACCRDYGTGPIHRIEASFTFSGFPEFFKTNIRCQADWEPLGCLGDLGWYYIRFAVAIFSTCASRLM
jgi:hypothetical protein